MKEDLNTQTESVRKSIELKVNKKNSDATDETNRASIILITGRNDNELI
jgi:hypothetical protein